MGKVQTTMKPNKHRYHYKEPREEAWKDLKKWAK